MVSSESWSPGQEGSKGQCDDNMKDTEIGDFQVLSPFRAETVSGWMRGLMRAAVSGEVHRHECAG